MLLLTYSRCTNYFFLVKQIKMNCNRYVEQLKNLFFMIRENTINDTNIYPIITIINSILTTQTNIEVKTREECTNLPSNDFVSKTLKNLKSTTKNFKYKNMIDQVISNHSSIRKTSGLSGFSRSRKKGREALEPLGEPLEEP